MKVLLTGSAGFIGFHTSKHLLERGDTVIGLDNFNDYYDPALKEARNKMLEEYENFTVIRGDIKDDATLDKAFDMLGNPPYADDTWSTWTSAVKEATGRKGKGLFMPLRHAVTGRTRGPEMSDVMPLLQVKPKI